MVDTKLIEWAQAALINCLEGLLFHGHQRNKIMLHCLPSRPNTLVPVVIVYNYFRWRPPWMTLESSSRICHCFVIIKVLSRWLKIRFNIQERSTLT
jgi:hypothetical protein